VSLLAKFCGNPKFQDFPVNFSSISTHRNSLNFHSNFNSNLDKFLYGKLFLISSSFEPYFISNFSSTGRHLLDRSKFGQNLNSFELFSIRFEFMLPGTVPLGPACQPVPPLGTVATAHRSAAPMFGWPSDVPRHTARARRGRAAAGAVALSHSRSCLSLPVPRPGRCRPCHTAQAVPRRWEPGPLLEPLHASSDFPRPPSAASPLLPL
jgi:hypothetical protein